MPEIIMVRHGEASASFRESTDPDPGLSQLGQAQAREVAARLRSLSGFDLFTSPLKRARETAARLASIWNLEPRIEPRVSEIPSESVALADRGEWLSEILSNRWSQVEVEQQAWRGQLLKCLAEADTPRIYFSHFVAINVVTGAATGDDRVVNTYPAHTSVFHFSSDAGNLSILERGDVVSPT